MLQDTNSLSWAPLLPSSESYSDSSSVQMSLIENHESEDCQVKPLKISMEEPNDFIEITLNDHNLFLRRINDPLFLKIIFLVSSVLSTLISQWLYYVKVADETNFLTVTSVYFGMSLVVFLPTLGKNKSNLIPNGNKVHKRYTTVLRALGLIDVLIGGLLAAGMFKIGSSLYQVVSSLLIPFTAFLAYIFLKRKLFILQWLGILAITIGFSFNTVISYMTSLPITTSENVTSNNLIQGVILTLIGVFFCAGHNVLSEKLLHQDDGPSPTEICYTIGLYGTMTCILIFTFYTLPQRYQSGREVLELALYATDIQKKQEAITFLSNMVFGFLSLAIIYTVQVYSYFLTVEISGAVSTGVLQALKSVGVIGLSGFLFCGINSNQCFSPEKITSAAMVVLGALMYSLSAK